jgi:hypothetical protein
MGESFDASDAYKINQDFVRGSPDSAVLAEMVKGWQTGIVAKTDVRSYMRRVGMIATERNDDDIDSDLQTEGPRLGTMGIDPATGKPVPITPDAAVATGQSIVPAASGNPPSKPGNAANDGATDGGSGSGNGGTNAGTANRNADANGAPADATGQGQNAGNGNGASRSENVVPIHRTPPSDPNVIDVVPRMANEAAPPVPPFDVEALVAAIRDAFASITFPAPVVNVAAPVVTVNPPAITVDAPTINVSPPTVNVASPNVTVNMPDGKAPGTKVGTMTKDGNGGYNFDVKTLPN